MINFHRVIMVKQITFKFKFKLMFKNKNRVDKMLFIIYIGDGTIILQYYKIDLKQVIEKIMNVSFLAHIIVMFTF